MLAETVFLRLPKLPSFWYADSDADTDTDGDGDSDTDTDTDTDTDADTQWYGTVSGLVTEEKLATEYAAWKTAYISYCDGDNSAYVRKDSNSTVSEGIAYGMLIAVGNDDQALFDKLSQFYHDHLDDNGLMNWAMDGCAPPGDNDANAATDADLDAAMALLQADAKWGGYRDKAVTLIGNIKDQETCEKGDLLVLRPGDAWAFCDEGNPETNPSYFSPGYYRAFAVAVPEQAEHWNRPADDTYKMITVNQTAMNGLLSDWCTFTGAIARSSGYGYEACRTPWRFSIDYAWTGKTEAKSVLEKLHNANAGANGDSNSCFRGGFALTAITLDSSAFDAAVDTWLTTTQYDNRYYQTTLRNLYLLVAGGKFLPVGL